MDLRRIIDTEANKEYAESIITTPEEGLEMRSIASASQHPQRASPLYDERSANKRDTQRPSSPLQDDRSAWLFSLQPATAVCCGVDSLVPLCGSCGEPTERLRRREMSQGYIQGGGDELPGTDIATGEKPGRETRGRDHGAGRDQGGETRGERPGGETRGRNQGERLGGETRGRGQGAGERPEHSLKWFI